MDYPLITESWWVVGIAYIFIFLVVSKNLISWSEKIRYFVNIVFFLKILVIFILYSSESIIPKQAASIPLEYWNNFTNLKQISFLLFNILNFPSFIVSKSFSSVAMLNSLLISSGILLLAANAKKTFSTKIANRIILYGNLIPSLWYWGIHGLRDPLIFFSFCLLISGKIYLNKNCNSNLLSLSGCLIQLTTRPEMVPFTSLFLIPKQDRIKKIVIPVIFVSVGVVLILLNEVPMLQKKDGFKNFISSRIEKAINSHQRSNFYKKPEDYSFLKGVCYGVACLIMTPLPVVPKNIWQFIVLIESIVLMSIFFYKLKFRIYNKNKIFYENLFLYILITLIFSPFIINAGNAYRIKFSYIPILIFMISWCNQNEKYKSSNNFSINA